MARMRGGKQVGDGWKEVQNETEERSGPAAMVCSPRHQAVKVTATISHSASLKSSFTPSGEDRLDQGREHGVAL